MKKHIFYWLLLGLVVITGCQKELSFELGNTPGQGSLQADVTGDCLPKTVNGIYVATTPLVPATNTITVQVNVLRTGTYIITTDTVNGYYFRATGTFTALGATNVTLRSNGTPFAAGVDNFIVSYNGTVCDIQVTVLPAGSGPATFSLVSGGTPTNCASAVVTGTYPKDNPLNGATNYVDITVTVATIGTYTITASGGGMTFTKTGTFTATGNQSVRLDGSGTPTTAGANTITFASPFTTCSFTVTVVASAAYTIDCPNVQVNGTYQVGTALGASNTIDIPITVITAGPYSISASVNGMTFTASGTLVVGPGSITLTGSTSTAPTGPAGIYDLSVGTPACLIPITVTGIDWKFNIGSTVYQGSTVPGSVIFLSVPPFTTVTYAGDNGATDDFSFGLADITGGILATETYNNITIGLTNGCAFYFLDGAGTLDLIADPGLPAIGNMTFTITSHNTTTKTIIGTFSGTALDFVSGTIKTITNGTFTAVYL